MSNTVPPVEGGFVRVPHSYIFLPISPQAKALLVAFCAYADKNGSSYLSFSQLAEILRRSKASVSTYTKELADAGLVACKNQRFGNGYNYRLHITIVGWSDLLAHWEHLTKKKRARENAPAPASLSVVAQTLEPQESPELAARPAKPARDEPSLKAHSSSQKAERSVQHTERKDPSGPINKIYQTKTPGVVWSKEDEEAWLRFRPFENDPPFTMREAPRPSILEKAIAYHASLASRVDLLGKQAATDMASKALSSFLASRGIAADPDHLSKCAEALGGIAKTPEAIAAAIHAIGEVWQPYWRRLSTPDQLVKTCSEAAAKGMPSRDEITRLTRFGNRAWIARQKLSELSPLPAQSTAA